MILNLLNTVFFAIVWVLGTAGSTVIPNQEYEALSDLYSSTNGQNWDYQGNGPEWFSNIYPCNEPSWQGLKCSCNSSNYCDIVEIQLASFKLEGTIPDSIADFTYLTTLNASNNTLSGEIPLPLWSIKNLTKIVLEHNILTGGLPDIFNKSLIQEIELGHNSLHGTLPVSLYNCSTLKVLDLTNNFFHGTISILSQSYLTLRTLLLGVNRFSGTLPGFGYSPELRTLALAFNCLNGTIPDSINRLPALVSLYLNNNNFTCSVPTTLFELSNLIELDIASNDLTGSLPSNIGNLVSLRIFYGFDNALSGSIPSSIESCTHLRTILLSNNMLNSTIPDGLFSPVIEVMLLDKNNLSGTISSRLEKAQNLRIFSVFNNSLVGHIPYNLSLLESLDTFSVAYNLLSGTIPNHFYGLQSLKSFFVNKNNFVGTITSAIGSREMISFDVSFNNFGGVLPEFEAPLLVGYGVGFNQFHGSIPTSIYSCPKLVDWSMSNNYLTGTISNSISGLVSLNSIFLDNNRLHGAIPSTIGELQNVQYIDLQSNHLNGTIPHGLYSLSGLLFLSLDENDFSGVLSNEIKSLSSLLYLTVAGNRFVGNIPNGTEQLRDLQYLDLSNNRFSGTLPHLQSFVLLQYLIISNNKLTGTIPKSLASLKRLTHFIAEYNHLNGSLPSQLYNVTTLTSLVLNNNDFTGSISPYLKLLVSLTYIDVADNQFTGSFPNATLTSLVTVYAFSNRFTGSIPESLCLLEALYMENNYLSQQIPNCFFRFHRDFLADLILNNNLLTGTLSANISSTGLISLQVNNNDISGLMPTTISSKVQILDLGYNSFTGGIMFNVSTLVQLLLNNNHLSQTVPASMGLWSDLNYLDLSANVLSGQLPRDLSSLKSMGKFFVNRNALNGNVDCFNASLQQNITNIELSNNQFIGTLPYEVFHVQTLQTFAAVSNCFTGSISDVVCNAQGLTALALDGLHTASSCHINLLPFGKFNTYTLNYYAPGSIPDCLFNAPNLNTLHVTGNGLKGTLSSAMTIGSSLKNLALSYNQFSGFVPSNIAKAIFWNLDLSNNRLGGALSTDLSQPPSNGSIFLDVNRFSDNVPESIRKSLNISVLDGNLLTCDFERKSLPEHDKEAMFYQCGTSEVQQAMYAWIILAGIAIGCMVFIFVIHRLYRYDRRDVFWIRNAKAVYVTFRQWRKIFLNSEKKNFSLPNVMLFGRFCNSVRWSFVGLTLFVLVVVLPVNIALSSLYSMYENKYAWSVSSVFLSGITPAIVLLFMFIVFIAFAFGIFYVNLVTFRTVKIKDRSSGRFSQFNRDSEKSSKTTSAPTLTGKSKGSYKHYLSLSAVALFNFVIVLAVNVAYVYITTKFSPAVVAITQLILSVFKLMWNDFAVRGLTILAHNYSTKSVNLTAAEDRALEGKYLSFNMGMLIFNVIIIPCMATAAVSSDCFYDVLFPPDNIESSYSYQTCATLETFYQLKQNNCTQFELVTTTTSYQPPFVYRYQCSSALITTYAVLYVYSFILVAFAHPLLMALLGKICSTLDSNSKLYKILSKMVPKLYRDSNTIVPNNARIFFKDRFNLRLSMYLSVFMTFGVIFPPLTVIICFAVIIKTYFTQFSIGRILDGLTIEAETDLKILQIFDYDCANTGDIFKQTVVYVGPISAFIYAFLVFDTYGDAVGGRSTLWAVLTLFIFGCLISAVYVIAVKRDPIESIKIRQSQVEFRTARHVSQITFSSSAKFLLRNLTIGSSEDRSRSVDSTGVTDYTRNESIDDSDKGRTSSTNPVHLAFEAEHVGTLPKVKEVMEEEEEERETAVDDC